MGRQEDNLGVRQEVNEQASTAERKDRRQKDRYRDQERPVDNDENNEDKDHGDKQEHEIDSCKGIPEVGYEATRAGRVGSNTFHAVHRVGNVRSDGFHGAGLNGIAVRVQVLDLGGVERNGPHAGSSALGRNKGRLRVIEEVGKGLTARHSNTRHSLGGFVQGSDLLAC